MRHDGGDAETSFGADIGAGLAWTVPRYGLRMELRGRGLLAHESRGLPGIRDFGLLRLGTGGGRAGGRG